MRCTSGAEAADGILFPGALYVFTLENGNFVCPFRMYQEVNKTAITANHLRRRIGSEKREAARGIETKRRQRHRWDRSGTLPIITFSLSHTFLTIMLLSENIASARNGSLFSVCCNRRHPIDSFNRAFN